MSSLLEKYAVAQKSDIDDHWHLINKRSFSRFSFGKWFRIPRPQIQTMIVVIAPSGSGKTKFIEHLRVGGFSRRFGAEFASIIVDADTPYLGGWELAKKGFNSAKYVSAAHQTIIVHLDLDVMVRNKGKAVPNLVAFSKFVKRTIFIKINPAFDQLQLASESRFERRNVNLSAEYLSALGASKRRKKSIRVFAQSMRYIGKQLDRRAGYCWVKRDPAQHDAMISDVQNQFGCFEELEVTAQQFCKKPRFFDHVR